MGKIVSRDEMLKRLRVLQGSRTATAFAAWLGVSPSFVSDIYNGNRDPGDKLLERLKLRRERVVVFRERD